MAGKYNAKKKVVDGIKFDSQKEAKHYLELKERQEKGEIQCLELQVRFELIPHQLDEKGKVIERACYYLADFVYYDNAKHRRIVEDVKSPATKTPVYKIKRKLMLFKYGIRIKEV